MTGLPPTPPDRFDPSAPSWLIDGARNYIAATQWTYARTLSLFPHWYCMRRRARESGLIVGHEHLYTLIARYGYERQWFRRTFRSIDIDGWTIWRLDQGGNGDFLNTTPIGSEPFEPTPRCRVHPEVEMRVDRITRQMQWHCIECDKANRPRR